MPFINAEHRENLNMDIPGDRCYVEYKHLMEEWRANPRWTTADSLMQELIEFMSGGATTPYKSAALLAFMVFFNMHIMKYEIQKMKENGDV